MAGTASNSVQLIITAVDQASDDVKKISQSFTDLGDNVKNTSLKINSDLTKAVADFGTKTKAGLEPISGALNKVAANAANTASVIKSQVGDAFDGLAKGVGALVDTSVSGLDGIGSGATAAATAVVAFAASSTNQVGRLARTIDGVNRAFQRLTGEGVGSLLGKQIEENIKEASIAGQYKLSQVLNSSTSAVKLSLGFGDTIKSAETAGDQVSQIFIDSFDLAKKTINSGFDFKEVVSSAKDASKEVNFILDSVGVTNPIARSIINFAPTIRAAESVTTDIKGIFNKDLVGSVGAEGSFLNVGRTVQQATEVAGQIQQSLGKATEAISVPTPDFTPVVKEATRASSQIEEVFSGAAASIIDRFDAITRKSISLAGKSTEKIAGITDAASKGLLGLSGLDETLNLFGALSGSVAKVVTTISEGSEKIFFFAQAFDILKGAVTGGPFELLIGQNVKLKETLIATQSTLAATTQILRNGVKIEDPTTAIQAIGPAVEGAISKIRKGSLDLVNVTSKDLVDAFQIVANEAGNVGFSLDDAAKLTLNFGATLGTLGVPLGAARQEIQSILQGTIDQNSIVAKSLGINNQQVESWKQQGKLVDNLLKKTEAFRAGNALSAKTFGGVTSNIQEFVDTIGLKAGAQLVDPIVDRLNAFLKFLTNNQDQIIGYITNVVGGVSKGLQSIVDALTGLFQQTQGTLINTLSILFEAFTSLLEALAGAIKTVTVVATPFIAILQQLSGLGQLINPLAQLGLQFKLLSVAVGATSGAFAIFANAIPGLGEALFLLNIRNSDLIGLFTGLTQTAELGIGSILTLGVNLNKVPFAFDAVASKIPVFGKQIASLIPVLSGGAFSLLEFAKVPAVGGVLAKLGDAAAKGGSKAGTGIKTFTDSLSALAGGDTQKGLQGIVLSLGQLVEANPALKPIAPTIKSIAQNTDLAALANKKLAETAETVRNSLVKMALSYTAIGLIVFAAVTFISEFVLKNEAVLKVLKAIGDRLQEFGTKIKEFFTSPLGIALTAVTGLVLAIKTGLVVSVTQAVAGFTKLVSTNVPGWLQSIYGSIQKFNSAITSVPGKISDVFTPTEVKTRKSVIADVINKEAEAIDAAIESRNTKIKKIKAGNALIAESITRAWVPSEMLTKPLSNVVQPWNNGQQLVRKVRPPGSSSLVRRRS